MSSAQDHSCQPFSWALESCDGSRSQPVLSALLFAVAVCHGLNSWGEMYCRAQGSDIAKNSLLVEGQDVIAKDLHDVAADPGIRCLGEVGKLAGRKHPAFR